ncbi:MAG: hypothetical protein R3290_06760 [Acidimicrobiia bacterium]|nr:hypothetical protein [Acidimicrobiia bacterium]
MHPSDQIATKGDIDRLDVRIDELASEMRSGFADVRSEFAAVRSEFAAVRSEFRSDLRTEIGSVNETLRTEIRGIHEAMRDQLRIYSTLTVGSLTALTAIFSFVVVMVA